MTTDRYERAPMVGSVAHLPVQPGDRVRAGQTLVVLESIKMEHLVVAPHDAEVVELAVRVGDGVRRDQPLVLLREASLGPEESTPDTPSAERADLAKVVRRHEVGLDENRHEAVQRRRRLGLRTARENVADLCDWGTFVEYGPLAVAAQTNRRPIEELVEQTPADGLVAGLGNVSGVRCAVLAYDATVLAGTQGARNHQKKDRLFELAERLGTPVVLFAEGGGGRPGDTDIPVVSSLDVPAFHLFARLSGLVPLVGIAAGRCFAGNAALLGCCDVVIATRDSTIGMGGPAMVEGGGLGVYEPEEIGPVDVQSPNGVVDVVVDDETAAVQVAKQYLSYVTQRSVDWTSSDQGALRDVVPENRVRAYDVRRVISVLADDGSVLELRAEFGVGVVTALVRVEGRPYGLIANNPAHLGGAIDADAADKLARFLQLCDAHGLPVVSLCDTPGFMVGPEAEKTATVRHFSRLFVGGAHLSVPLLVVVLRKAYGLGAMGMAGGSVKVPVATVAWPTGELGAMGLEGAVRLGFRRELEAIDDPDEREADFQRRVAEAYERGKGLNAASIFEIDDVIDPADTRRWITATLGEAPRTAPRKRRFIDTW